MEAKSIPLHLIKPPANPHRLSVDDAAIIELAKDIRDRGLINPITVRRDGDQYEVIAGHRRLLAHQHLGLPLVECRIADAHEEAAIEAIRVAENLQRENLSPVEEAIQVYNLVANHEGDVKKAARACHRSEAWIDSRLQLQRAPDDLQQMCHERALSIGAALQLARLEDPATRTYFTRLATRDGCTVQILARWIDEHFDQLRARPDQAPALPPTPPPGGRLVVYLNCELCDVPTDVHDRMPKFVCPICQEMWEDFRAARQALHHEAHQATEAAQVTQ